MPDQPKPADDCPVCRGARLKKNMSVVILGYRRLKD